MSVCVSRSLSVCLCVYQRRDLRRSVISRAFCNGALFCGEGKKERELSFFVPFFAVKLFHERGVTHFLFMEEPVRAVDGLASMNCAELS